MTTPNTQPQTDRITAAEIRDLFAELNGNISALMFRVSDLENHIEAMRGGLQTAATPPAVGTFSEMMIAEIIMTYDDNGKAAYKAKGAPYQKHGVRVWDEVLPTLGIDPATLTPGPNTIEPIRARVLMNAPTEEGKTAQPRKVTGKA